MHVLHLHIVALSPMTEEKLITILFCFSGTWPNETLNKLTLDSHAFAVFPPKQHHEWMSGRGGSLGSKANIIRSFVQQSIDIGVLMMFVDTAFLCYMCK